MALVTFANGNVLEAQELNDSFAAVDWNENVVINGAIQVAQRGTSTASITTSGYYTADCYRTLLTTQGTWTQSVENDAPTGSGFRKSLKMLVTTADASPAAGDLVLVQQPFEGQNVQVFAKGTASAKQYAASFWVKSNVTGTYVAALVDSDNTRVVSATYTISASGTWEKKTIIFPADTTGVLDNDNNESLTLRFWLGAGSDRTSGTLNTTWAASTTANLAVGQTNVAAAINNYWQVTGVQLQPSRESQYLFQDYGTVLAQCQRYYERINIIDYRGPICQARSANDTNGWISFKVTKRAAPTMSTAGTFSAWNANSAGTAATVTFSGITVDGSGLDVATSGKVAGNASLLGGDTSATFIASSEL